MVQCLWDCQVDAIIDVKLGDADADSYKCEPMKALLVRWGTIKKDKYGKHCHNQWKKCLSFVLSVDGMLGRESLFMLSQLSRFMANKIKYLPLQVRGWLKGQITIAITGYYSWMICGDCPPPSPLREWEPGWDPESGISLAG